MTLCIYKEKKEMEEKEGGGFEMLAFTESKRTWPPTMCQCQALLDILDVKTFLIIPSNQWGTLILVRH